jgi:hypothetical protein
MVEKVTISVKISKNIYDEMSLRIPQGERSNFIRDTIFEKLNNTPKPNKILKLEKRIRKVEDDFSLIKKSLADLEILTYEKGKVNPHIFCIDKIDHSILDYLLHYSGATTSEIAKNLEINRWLALNRLKRIQRLSKKQLGKTIVEYVAREKAGKKRAWWFNEEI